ncbi:MAG: Maf family nucleotide pyrophosphatase [Parvularculaceae bacterium]
MTAPLKLCLASASPRRRDLLAQICVAPDAVCPADIDENPTPGELPANHAARLAREKAEAARKTGGGEALYLAADTVVGVGRRILPKAEDEETARACLQLISGRSHRVYTGVALACGDKISERLVETRVKVRRLSADDIDAYVASGEWRGKAGGYAIQGLFARHVVSIIGSYSNVVGLPLYETANLLKGAGYTS